MKKASTIVSLALAILMSGCQTQNSEFEARKDSAAVNLDKDLELEKQRFVRKMMENGWVHYTQGSANFSMSILPIDYEYNWKSGEQIGETWVGIEGGLASSLEKGKYSLEVSNYIPFEANNLIGENLPEGHSLIIVYGYNKHPDKQKINQMFEGLEEFVSRNGEKLEIGLTEDEMNTLEKSLRGF